MIKLKDVLRELDGTIHNRFRLVIMSVLLHDDWVDYNDLKIVTDATDGNLASHLKKLEAVEYIVVRKKFIGRRPNTSYRLTNRGKKAMIRYSEVLSLLAKTNQNKIENLKVD